MRHGEQVVLDNGQVRYRCTMRTESGPCYRDFDKPGSVSSHLKVHSAKWQEKHPTETKTETAPDATAEPGIIAKLTQLVEFAEAVGDDLGAVTDAFEAFKKDLHAVVQELPEHVTDADTREKVRKYEELQATLSNLLK